MRIGFFLLVGVFVFLGQVEVEGQVEGDTLELTGTLVDTVVANRLIADAAINFNQGKYSKSVVLLLESDSIVVSLLGKENNMHLRILEQLIPSYFFSKQLEESEFVTNEYLGLALKKFGHNHISIVNAYRNLGNIDFTKNRYNEAIEKYYLALDVYSMLPPKEQVSSYRIYNLLAKSYDNIGRDSEAVNYFEKAINGCESFFNGNSLKCTHITVALAGLYSKLDSLEKANYHLKHLLNLYENEKKPNNDIITILDELGRNYLKLDFPDSAIMFHTRSLNIQNEILGNVESPAAAFTYNGLGLSYFEKGDYSESLLYAKKSLRIRENSSGKKSIGTSNSLSNIGNIYYIIGDFEKALYYFFASLEIEKGIPNLDLGIIAKTYNNIGALYGEINNFDKAIENHETALRLRLERFGENNSDVAQSYNNLGIIYQLKGEYDMSINYKEKAIAIFYKLRGPEHSKLGTYYINLGNSYNASGNYQKAIEFYEKGLVLLRKSFGSNHPYISETCTSLGKVYSLKEDYDKAKYYYQEAMSANRYHSDCNFDSIMHINSLIEVLNNYSKLYIKQYLKEPKAESLSQSFNLSNQALKAITYQFKTLTSELLKADLLKNGLTVYENALHVNQCMQSKNNEKKLRNTSFGQAESSKSLMLFGSLKENDALSIAGIPDSILLREYNLRTRITYIEKMRFEEENKGKGAIVAIVNDFNNQLFDLKTNYEALKKHLETQYPEYYRLKYDLSTVSLQYVQDTLLEPQNQALLEYFVGDSSIYLFVVRPDTMIVQEVNRDFPLEDWIEGLRYGIYGYYAADKATQTDSLKADAKRAYLEFAPKLYQKLVAPVAQLLPEKVVLVPDGPLGYVPFDALLTAAPEDANNFKSYPYLIQKHQFSYTYSATLLREMRDKKHRQEPQKDFVAFAPFYNGDTTLLANMFAYDDLMRKDLQPLAFSGPEVAAASKLMNGETVAGTAATEGKFTSIASNYRIIHLATHGRADNRVGDYAFLAFTEIKDSIENELLYVKDLYNLQLNADLVVLSACETGIGKLQRGEGIISLARAFAYAGAKSIVTSLWSVNDKSTSELMRLFYRELQRGKDKDEALRLARLRFLKESSVKNSHPFFWAAFVPLGDMRPVR